MDRTADALVVFGLTGDLGTRMTIPALFRLHVRDALPCDVVGIGRQERSTDEVREMARESVRRAQDTVDDDELDAFAKRLSYVPADATDEKAIARLAEFLGPSRHTLFYLALPPSLFAPIVQALGRAGLTEHARVVVEKPFGHDLASARELNAQLLEVLDDDQILRIDHFLGKEPVQDLIYLRFANELFEPVWNRHHIEAVQLNLAESFGIEGRGSFYDDVGALRDVVQNHILQVLALVAMEPPAGGHDAVARRRLDVLRAIPDADPADYVRGQYEGYLDEDGVEAASETETFAALKLEVDNWRWSGVPFLIRAGKGLPLTRTEVDARFRRPPPILMGTRAAEVKHHNHVSFRIGQDAGASLGLLLKDATSDSAEPTHLDVSFREHVEESPSAYERLLGDALVGNDSLFPSQRMVEELWRIVQPLLDDPPAVERYARGTWGPKAADRLAEPFGGWRNAPTEA